MVRFFRSRKIKVLKGDELEKIIKSRKRILSFQSHLKYPDYVREPIKNDIDEKLAKSYELLGYRELTAEDMRLMKIELDKIILEKRKREKRKNKIEERNDFK